MNARPHLSSNARQASHRELPLRLFEFRTVVPYEKSAVHDLLAPGMTQATPTSSAIARISCANCADPTSPRLATRIRLTSSISSFRPTSRQARSDETGGRHRGAALHRHRNGPRLFVMTKAAVPSYPEDLSPGPKMPLDGLQMSTVQLDSQLPDASTRLCRPDNLASPIINPPALVPAWSASCRSLPDRPLCGPCHLALPRTGARDTVTDAHSEYARSVSMVCGRPACGPHSI